MHTVIGTGTRNLSIAPPLFAMFAGQIACDEDSQASISQSRCSVARSQSPTISHVCLGSCVCLLLKHGFGAASAAAGAGPVYVPLAVRMSSSGPTVPLSVS